MAKLSTYIGALTLAISPFTDVSTGAGSVDIVSAAMQVDTGSGTDVGAANIDGAFGIDIDESSGYIELTALPTGGRCDIAHVDASERGYRCRLTSTQFTLSSLIGGAPTTLSGPTTWSAGSHKFYRIREAAGTTYLEMAGDNGYGAPGTWVTIYSEATTTTGWTHTSIDMSFFAPAAVGTGVSRYRYCNTFAQFEQRAFRWRNDDGSETTATWAAAQNTDISVARNLTRRLRLQVQSIGDRPAQAFKLQYRKVGAPSWSDV